ncbi:MAG: phosphoribosylformylglycinamidine synthase subunit PurS [Gemmatimonadetes bacterium]|nr:phosphoribosylformylglycinamidine synthase subunit PurS [Gemmatimonadota bacterium]
MSPKFAVEVRVMPRRALLDPQGQAVEHALDALGFKGVGGVRVGKALTLELERPDSGQAEDDARSMCERLLANPVTEDFTLSVRPVE